MLARGALGRSGRACSSRAGRDRSRSDRGRDRDPDDATVAHRHDAVGPRGEARLVRHEHDGRAAVGRQRGEELDDLVAARGVERAGRLVGEQQAPGPDDRAGDRDALLLATREVVGIAVELLVETDGVERVDRLRRARARPVPSSSSGSMTFSIAVSAATRFSRWNT